MNTTLKRKEETLIPRLFVARDFFSRLRGLMGRTYIPSDEGICFPRCNSIHTFFMRFPIDVLFIDANGKVVDLLVAFRPWRLALPRRLAKYTVELKAFKAQELGITIGTTLACPGVWS